MRFIRYSRRGLILFVVLATSACQFVAERQVGGIDEQVSNSDASLKILEKKSSINPYLDSTESVSSTVLERFRNANEALVNDDFDFAEQELRWIIDRHPNLSGPTLNLALLHSVSGNSEQAEIYFRETIERNSKNIHAYNQYGIFLREQGRFMEAEKAYQEALVVWPKYPDANINIAILYDLYMGRLEQAVTYYAIYRDLLEQPGRQINGWIIDAERRLATTQR